MGGYDFPLQSKTVRLLAAVVAKSGCPKFVATILGKPFWGAWLGDNWANLVSRK